MTTKASREEREAALIKLFAKNGLELTFVGKYKD